MELTDALSFLAERRQGILITQRANGRPQSSNVAYAVVDGVVLISITADRAKYHNLVRTPLASLHVNRDDFWAYAVVDGDVELSPVVTAVADPAADELVTVYRAIAGEHPDWDDYRQALVRDRRLVVRLRPTHAYGMLSR